MRIRTFLQSAGQGRYGMRKRDVLRCFHEGMVAEGADAVLVEESGYEPCEVAIIFGGRPSSAP